MRSLKIAAAVLLLSGPVVLVPHAATSGLDAVIPTFGFLAVVVGVIAIAWVKPRVIGWLLLPVSVAMFLLAVLAVEWGHAWRDAVWSAADVLWVAIVAGVPLLAGIALLVAGVQSRARS